MAPRIVYPVPDLDEWSKPKYQIQMQRDPSSAGYNDMNVPDDFETRRIRFEDRPEDDAAWQHEQMLGRGGYGLVGHWAKRDGSGNIVDNLAVKEVPMPRNNLYRMTDNGRLLPEEAIIQTAMQKKGCGPVLQFRGLSILVAPEGHHDKIRYYLEYCENGSLFEVLKQYSILQYRHRDRLVQIPENYLWQLLHNFAQVMLAMENGPFDHPVAELVGDNPYVLHLDLKPDNILLGETIDEDIIKGYPSCKVADWGLAKVTSLIDEGNSWDYRHRGTRHWYPPEQYRENTFGAHWRPLPPWRQGWDVDSHPYTPAHSVFAFASIIFRMMILDGDLSKLDMYIENAAQAEAYCQSRNYRFIDDYNMNWNRFDHQTAYSDLLKNTIADCLHIDPAQRPTAAFLENLARQQSVQRAAARAQSDPNTFQALMVKKTGQDYLQA